MMRSIPILETVEPGTTIVIAEIRWSKLLVNNWNYDIQPAETVGMILRADPAKPATQQEASNDDGHEIQMQIVVAESGYLFGDEDIMQLTTKQGAAGGTITIHRHDDESRSLASSYSLI